MAGRQELRALGEMRVVKFGGNELDRTSWLAGCAAALYPGGPIVVVHGGGKAVDALSRRLGLPVEKRDGLRVTSAEVAEATEMTLAGSINRRLVSALRAGGIDAVGLSGVDGGLITARLAKGDLGFVGDVAAVRVELLHTLLVAGYTPVVAPVAPSPDGPDGVPLNINADYAAAGIAGALGASELLLVTDVAGFSIDGVVQREVDVGECESLVARRVAADGMVTKLRAAVAALAGGARAVRIGDLRMIQDPTAGTRVVAGSHQPA
jgi:acetylglutamate kinase